MSTHIMTQERIYTVNEVAATFRFSRRTILRMIARGELDAFYASSEWRITQSALDDVMRRKPQKKKGN